MDDLGLKSSLTVPILVPSRKCFKLLLNAFKQHVSVGILQHVVKTRALTHLHISKYSDLSTCLIPEHSEQNSRRGRHEEVWPQMCYIFQGLEFGAFR